MWPALTLCVVVAIPIVISFRPCTGRGPRLDVDEFEPRIAEIMRSVTPLRTFMSMCSIAAKALTFAAEISTPNVATYA